ncbi:hypothetical protein PAPYR_13292 [Paratrimastix pyriformis]|uniref:Uncharacterized protein n=1 Tax=Paratrimastix pyriformis TaxID=342808 RepID=A0ABQ8U0G2_9EUKA|nr:hypothetical protein PAPYR_13292 [Paratrimastix pyriformis]
MREGAEENPGFGENLDGRMEDHAGWECVTGWRHRGHTTLAQVAGAGFLLLTTPFEFRQCSGTGRFGGRLSDIMDE